MAKIIFKFLEALEHIISETDRSLEEWIEAYKARHDSHSPPAPPVVTPEPPTPVPVPTPAPALSDAPSDGSVNFLEGLTASDLYVQNGVVAQFVAQHPTDPNYALLKGIAEKPTGVWLTGGTPSEVYNQVTETLKAAAGKLVTFVVYNIPARDNGGQSAGGAGDQLAYYAWCGAIDAAIKDAGNPRVVLIMEPDALGFAQQKQNYEQYETLKVGIDILTQHPNRSLYLDISMWNKPSIDAMVEAIRFLKDEDKMVNLRGWSLNISGYNSDAECHAFGEALCSKVGGYYIVDTSRNGRGPAPAAQWENVSGMKLGAAPLMQPARVTFDGNVWAKPPGESDGSNNGQPPAGQFAYKLGVELAS